MAGHRTAIGLDLEEGLLLAAEVLCVLASWVERASSRFVDRIGQVADENDALAVFELGIDDWDR